MAHFPSCRLLGSQLFFSILLAPVILFPEKVPDGIFLGALAALAIPWLYGALWGVDRSPWQNRLILLVLLFLLYHLPSLWASADPRISMQRFGQNLLGIGFLAGLALPERSPAQIKRLLFLGLLAAAALAVALPFLTTMILPNDKYFAAPSFWPRQGLTGDSVQHNILAGMLVALLPVGVALSVSGARDYSPFPRLAQTVLAGALVSILGVLVITQSRGGLLAVLVAEILFVVIWAVRARKWILIFGASVVAVILAKLASMGFQQAVKLVFADSVIKTMAERQEAWSRALFMIQDFPFTGIGLGLFSKIGSVMYPFFLASPEAPPTHSHHLILQVAVDLGLPGLVIWSAHFGAGLVSARQSGLCSQARLLQIGLLCSLVAILVHGQMDSPLWGSKMAPIPWIVVGMLLALKGVGKACWLHSWEVMVWWLILSLWSIALLGDRPVTAVAFAFHGGLLLGLVSLMEARSAANALARTKSFIARFSNSVLPLRGL